MGSGYKVFSSATKATAADINNYLMTQAVMTFATAAARDSAITAPVQGMAAYIKSGDSSEGLYTYNGTSWRKGPGWNAPWGVVGRATTSSASSTTTSTTDWSGLSVTWTAINNRVYRTMASGMITSNNTGGSDYASLIITDGSNTQLAGAQAIVQNTVYEGRFVQYLEAGVTGSQTRKVRILRNSGAGSVSGYASATWQASIVVEDLGPSGAPA